MLTLVILDGFGERALKYGNAIKSAKTPNIKMLKKQYPHTTLRASEGYVGLVNNQPGNSEAGHINMGAGYIVKQDLKEINDSIKDKSFYSNKVLLSAINHAKNNNSNLHIMGLYSNGGVHSKIKHLKAILKLAKAEKIKNIYLHLFCDGRDVPFNSGKEIFSSLEKSLKNKRGMQIATVCGRVYAMDREQRYDRLKTAYDSIVNAQSKYNFDNVVSLFDYFYDKKIYDEFIPACTINNGQAINDNDSIIFYNFRSDRARELTEAICENSFSAFATKKLKNIYFASMAEYNTAFENAKPMFILKNKNKSVGEILEANNLKQFRVSETTKYAHITFFFNGGREKAFIGEDRKLIESKDVLSFDQYPPMRAREITTEVINAINSQKYDFILTNLSNCDMIGHTGNYKATVETVEIIDECIGKIFEAVKNTNSDLIVIADHGNADFMLDKAGKKVTAHSFSKVPFILVSKRYKEAKLNKDCVLSGIAPTILKILNIKKPSYMTSKTIVK